MYQSYAQCSTGCTITHTGSGSVGSGTITLTTGDTLCITASGGNIEVDYDAVRFRPGSGLKMCSATDSDTVKWNNPISFFSGGSGTHVTFWNYGNFEYTVGTLGYQRVNIHNYGYWNINGDFNQNSTGPPNFYNYAGATVHIEGTVDINNGEFLNEGDFTVDGDLDFNGNDFTNTSNVTVGGHLTINSSSTVSLNGGVFIATDLTLNGGDFDASGSEGCSAFLITNSTTVQSGVNVTGGEVWITDSTDADTVNVNNCGGPSFDCGINFNQQNDCYTALPVELIHFTSQLAEGGVLLHWTTLTEINNNHFIIERSTDLEIFHPIGVVGGNGTTSEVTNYQFLDQSSGLSGTVYYRLRQVDFDGTSSYSKITMVNVDQFIVELYPTFVEKEFTLFWTNADRNLARMEIVGVTGTVFHDQIIESEQNIDVSNLATGTYYVRLLLNNQVMIKRIVKI